MSPQKLFLFITYLLEDEQELSLGMLIHCKCIYNFLYEQDLTLCFTGTCWCFYGFSATNILTRCHSASFRFLLFLIPEKLKNKYSRNRKKKLFYEVLYRKTPEARGGPPGVAWVGHSPLRAGKALGAPRGGVGPLAHSRLRPFAY